VRPASRVARLVALWLVAVTLSIGWLLLRRRTRRGPLLRAVPDLPADAVPQPRATRPAEARPAEAQPAEALQAVARSARAQRAEPQPTEPRRPEPLTALGRPMHDAVEVARDVTAPTTPAEAVSTDVVAAPEPGPAPAVVAQPAPPGGSGIEPEQADDLRRIRGIGPAIESSLHGLGIRSYRQLVMLDEAGLDRVRDAGRDFRQRIEREDWIGQARQLHREKYGEEV